MAPATIRFTRWAELIEHLLKVNSNPSTRRALRDIKQHAGEPVWELLGSKLQHQLYDNAELVFDNGGRQSQLEKKTTGWMALCRMMGFDPKTIPHTAAPAPGESYLDAMNEAALQIEYNNLAEVIEQHYLPPGEHDERDPDWIRYDEAANWRKNTFLPKAFKKYSLAAKRAICAALSECVRDVEHHIDKHGGPPPVSELVTAKHLGIIAKKAEATTMESLAQISHRAAARYGTTPAAWKAQRAY